MYSSMALKSGGPCTFGPPLTESEGVRATTGSPLLPLCHCWSVGWATAVVRVIEGNVL